MHSRRFTLGYALAGLLVAAAPVAALKPDPLIGTWILNVAKSKYTPGPAPKSSTVVYEAAGEGIHVVATTVNSEGKTIHLEYTANFDGKDYPVTGSPDYNTTALKRVSPRKLEFTRKQDGKVVQTGRITVSEGGKHRTAITDGTNAAGQTIHSEAVYDKKVTN
jgi:hypothetical protein